MRVTKITNDARALAHFLADRRLKPLIVRDALAHWLRNPQNYLSEKACITLDALASLNSGSLMNVSDQPVRSTSVATTHTDEGRTLDQVALPGSGKLPVLNLLRSRIEEHQARELTTPLFTFDAMHTLVVGVAKVYMPRHALKLPNDGTWGSTQDQD